MYRRLRSILSATALVLLATCARESGSGSDQSALAARVDSLADALFEATFSIQPEAGTAEGLLNAEHGRLSHAQSLLEAVRQALDALAEGDAAALGQAGHAQAALQAVTRFDATLEPVVQVLGDAKTQLQDAVHSLRGYLQREVDDSRLASLDARLSTWIGLARRFRRPSPSRELFCLVVRAVPCRASGIDAAAPARRRDRRHCVQR